MRPRHLALLLLLAAPVATAASPAEAQSAAAPAGDVIHLKNGGQIRGTIVDVIPGSHARIQLATGEVATVPWGDIERVESGRAAAPAPSAPAPATVAPVASKLVHIDAPRPVALDRQAPGAREWVTMCTSPCDRQVPASGTYRIGGSGVRASKPFTIEAMSDARIFIDVDAASKGWFVGGIVLTSVGGMTTIIGLFVTLIGAVANDATHSDNSLTAAGLGVTGVGAVALVSGLVALTSNVHSTANVSVTPPAPPGSDITKRLPTWNVAAGTRAPAGVSVPLFTATW